MSVSSDGGSSAERSGAAAFALVGRARAAASGAPVDGEDMVCRRAETMAVCLSLQRVTSVIARGSSGPAFPRLL